MGISDKMSKKDWTDSQGRKGKVIAPSPFPTPPPNSRPLFSL